MRTRRREGPVDESDRDIGAAAGSLHECREHDQLQEMHGLGLSIPKCRPRLVQATGGNTVLLAWVRGPFNPRRNIECDVVSHS
jgi:hypothetical protein